MSENETTEMWAGYHEARRQKRVQNAAYSTQALTDAGVHFRAYNGGAHLIIQHEGKTVDFWPGTGLWKDRMRATQNRGLVRLLKHLGVKSNE